MRALFESPTISSAVIAASAVLVTAILSLMNQRKLRRDDIVLQGLNAQITGWHNLHQAGIILATELRKELQDTKDECAREINDLKNQMRTTEHECSKKIRELESHLQRLTGKVSDLDNKNHTKGNLHRQE